MSLDVKSGNKNYEYKIPIIDFGIISIRPYPTNCSVKIDGIDVGEAPIHELKINTGFHRFEIKCLALGFNQTPYTQELNIVKGYNKMLTPIFEKNNEPI